MNRDIKMNLITALFSGLFLSAGYVLLCAYKILPVYYGHVPIREFERASHFFWILSLPKATPDVLFIIGAALLMDIFVRTANQTYSARALLRFGNLIKYALSLGLVIGAVIYSFQFLYSDILKENEFVLFARFAYINWYFFSNPSRYLAIGTVIGALAALLYSEKGFLGDMQSGSVGFTNLKKLIITIVLGAMTGTALGAIVYISLESLYTAHDIVSGVVYWAAPLGQVWVGLLLLPAPAAFTLFIHALLDEKLQFRSRAVTLAAAVLVAAALFSFSGIERAVSNKVYGYSLSDYQYPFDLFVKYGQHPQMSEYADDTLIVFSPGSVLAYSRRKQCSETNPYNSAPYNYKNYLTALDKVESNEHDARGYQLANGFLALKAKHEMNIEEELEWEFRRQEKIGDAMYRLIMYLDTAAVTPYTKDLLDRLSDPKRFYVDCFVCGLGGIYRHQGRDEEAVRFYKRSGRCPYPKKMVCKYPYNCLSKVFVNGVVKGRLTVGGRPAAGAKIALVTNVKKDVPVYKGVRYIGAINGRQPYEFDSLATGTVTDGNGYFRFDGLGDDLTYYLVVVAPPELIPPLSHSTGWEVPVRAENAPGIIAVSRGEQVKDLGVINLPEKIIK